jgi:hypothetical protein
MKNSKTIIFNDENIQSLFGFEDAESEPIERLKESYFKKNIFDNVTSNVPIRILVGHKGTGKSALFKIAISEDIEKGNFPILIKPDDIAELGKNDDNFLLRIRQWKYGLNKVIGAKVLKEIGLFNDSVENELRKFGVKLIPYISNLISSNMKNIDIEPSKKILMKNFLKAEIITIYLDDLDRGWEGKSDDIIRISSLLNCIRDMANEDSGLHFKVSLRSDVYYLVRTSDESTDKIEGSVVWIKWTNQEILIMLIKRIVTFFGESINEVNLMQTPTHHLIHYLEPVMETTFHGSGKWNNAPIDKVLMSLSRKRPRDLVKLCTLAARFAHESRASQISTIHFEAIFEQYSQGRIQDTINEYRSELNNIEKLLFGMKPAKRQKHFADYFLFTTTELHQKINNIMQQNTFVFANKKTASAAELSHFLYKINFLTARKDTENGEIHRKYFEENRYLSSSSADFGFNWEVHPVFRWALQPDSLDDIFKKVGLSDK